MSNQYKNYSNFGAIFWALNIQYYVIQIIVSSFWLTTNKYSWTNNTISDLANTQCATYGSREVCSPKHTIMNVSFIILGATIISGAYLFGKINKNKHMYMLGFYSLVVAGIGSIIVGLFPENSIHELHIFGAALSFVFGNVALLLIGLTLKHIGLYFRVITITAGLIALIALFLFLNKIYFGLGEGAIERIVSYPQTIWMIIFAIHSLLNVRINNKQTNL